MEDTLETDQIKRPRQVIISSSLQALDAEVAYALDSHNALRQRIARIQESTEIPETDNTVNGPGRTIDEENIQSKLES
ncbi:hypothetical protein KC678_01870 [Candidatus Dojkabacteria bacterium]|uniref:Uncharacterized protein n=1 Tax=Candidatus Dojkabacteria bacterium TaxID=2099670 RepID=A0A955L1K0_9BACT|nr:hypothetical protein [Candidatus Dojkabacteria bacterium]